MIGRLMDLARTLEEAARGDRAAWQALLTDFYPQVRALVHKELELDFRKRHKWMLPLFSTGDVVQEVFLGVVKGLKEFEVEDESSFARYLSTLVKHRLLDAVRFHEAARRDNRKVLAEPEQGLGVLPRATDDPTPSLQASLNEQLGVYREILATLPEKQRLLLELRLAEELPFADIATKLGIASADAARKAFHEAQAKLLVKMRAKGIKPPGEGTQ